MRKLLFAACCLLGIAPAYGQLHFTITGSAIVHNVGATLTMPYGQFVNNASYTDTAGAGTFNDDGGVTFSGSGTTLMYDLNINSATPADLAAMRVSVYHTATIASGASLAAGTGNLWLRTDIPAHSATATLVNDGFLTGTVTGLQTYATVVSGACSSYSSTLSINVSGASMVYQWQDSSSSTGGSWLNVSGATSAAYGATVSSTIWYRCALSTSNTAYSQNTPSIQLFLTSPPSISVASSSGCSGSTLTASGGATYTWAPSTNLSATTGSIVVATPVVSTTYTVTGTSGCSNTATVNVTPSVSSVVFDNGSAQSLLVCASSVAVPVSIQMAASGPFFSTFTYTVITSPAHGTLIGFPATVAGGTSVYPTTTKYQPTYGYTGSDAFVIRVSNGSCIATTTVNVTVSGAMPALINVTGGGGFCSGSTGLNVGLSGSAMGISYQLYRGISPVGGPAAGIGTALNFGLQTVAGTYTAMAINGPTGCRVPCNASATITVYPLPAVYAVTGGGSFCTGGSGVRLGISGSVTGVTYKLYAGGPMLTSLTGTGSARDFGLYTAAGTYTVTATSSPYGCVVPMTGSATVSVNPNPTVTGSTYTIAPGGSTTLTGSISGGIWTSSAPAVATIGSSSGTVSGVAVGTTVVTYTLPTGCVGTRIIYVSTFGRRPGSSGIADVADGITVLPNPNNGIFTIKGSLDIVGEQQMQIQLTNVLGQRVYSNSITILNGEIDETLGLGENLANGMYILTLRTGTETRAFHLSVRR